MAAREVSMGRFGRGIYDYSVGIFGWPSKRRFALGYKGYRRATIKW